MTQLPDLSRLFYEPLLGALQQCQSTRACPKHSDFEFLLTGTDRCLSKNLTGREYLQSRFSEPSESWTRSHYFETLKSKRRMNLVVETSRSLAKMTQGRHSAWQWPDNLPELEEFEIYAGDGHHHKAAVHESKGPKYAKAPAHFFARDLRSATLHHMGAAQSSPTRHREHDMHMLKRKTTDWLRLGTPKGQKVLYVWDRAGIDFGQWYKWKQAAGIYFLTRAKKNMTLKVSCENNWDKTDPRNAGVQSDTMVFTSSHVSVRCVRYEDPLSGTTFTFVTNLPESIPPGIVAWLYQRRWDVEKTFDETKNRFFEAKSWATSQQSREIQGAFIAIAYNLMLILEETMRQAGDLPADTKEDRRRLKRHDEAIQLIKNIGRKINYNLQNPPRRSQIGSKFIRWVRRHISSGSSYSQALPNLKALYEHF